MAGIDIISDSTGKEIVAAIQSTDVTQARILEINTAAEAKKNEVLESIPEDYTNLNNDVAELKGDLDSLGNEIITSNILLHKKDVIVNSGGWYTYIDYDFDIKNDFKSFYLYIGSVENAQVNIIAEIIFLGDNDAILETNAINESKAINTACVSVPKNAIKVRLRLVASKNQSVPSTGVKFNNIVFGYGVSKSNQPKDFSLIPNTSFNRLIDSSDQNIIPKLSFVHGGLNDIGSLYTDSDEYNNSRYTSDGFIQFLGNKLECICAEGYKCKIVQYDSAKSPKNIISYNNKIQLTYNENLPYFKITVWRTSNAMITRDDILNNVLVNLTSFLPAGKNEINIAALTENIGNKLKYINLLDLSEMEKGGIGLNGNDYNGDDNYREYHYRTQKYIPILKGQVLKINALNVKGIQFCVRVYYYSSENPLGIIKNSGDYSNSLEVYDGAVENAKYFKVVITNRSNEPFEMSNDLLSIRRTSNINWLNNLDSTTRKVSGAKSVFSIMSYNCGEWWIGSGKNVPTDKFDSIMATQKSIIERYNPDVLSICEYANIFSGKYFTKDILLDELFYESKEFATDSIYRGKAICSKSKIENSEEHVLSTGSICIKFYVYLNGRKVCIVNTHLDAHTEENRSKEIDEIISLVSNEEYLILCGDWNVNAKNKESNDYKNTIKKFKDMGLKCCNDGVYETYYSANPKTALDDIIVSQNINIKSFIVDTQKLENNDFEGPDHMPVIAYLEIF